MDQKTSTQYKIIAGNVSTPEAVKALSSWGADVVKGIGQGSLHKKDKTGFTAPMFTCVQNCLIYILENGVLMKKKFQLLTAG